MPEYTPKTALFAPKTAQIRPCDDALFLLLAGADLLPITPLSPVATARRTPTWTVI
jgi:hypothetical protein